MRIFATNSFVSRKDRLDNTTLRQAIREIEAGLVDAHLGGALVKKRIPGKGKGKRGGYRTIVAVRDGERAFFLYSFAKSARGNITARELAALKHLASALMGYTDGDLDHAVTNGVLTEVQDDDEGK